MSIQQRQLDLYLNSIRQIHHHKIDLSLERIQAVAKILKLNPMPAPVITVAGTNGKGSLIAMLEKIYLAQNYKVVSYTSPYFFHISEQIRYQGDIIDAEVLLDYLRQVGIARQDISLTEFEFITLAALCYFKDIQPDIILLEIGMGGRQDAVNIIDPSVSIITNIALDHQQYLGTSREEIANEKAGIMRQHTPVICGDEDPPISLLNQVTLLSAPFYRFHQDFICESDTDGLMTWHAGNKTINDLPSPGHGDIDLLHSFGQ